MLLFTKTQITNIKKAEKANTGLTIKLSARQIQANVTVEGGFLSLLAGLAATALPWLAKTLLPGLATGLISGGVEKAIAGSSVSGSGVEQDGFIIQKNGECYEGTYKGGGLYLNPSNYRREYGGDGLYLRAGGQLYQGGELYQGGSILRRASRHGTPSCPTVASSAASHATATARRSRTSSST